jgi:hypothetical protein
MEASHTISDEISINKARSGDQEQRFILAQAAAVLLELVSSCHAVVTRLRKMLEWRVTRSQCSSSSAPASC